MKQLNVYCQKIGTVAALLFAFFIPLSTSLTNVCIYLALLMWCLSGDWALKKRLLFQHPISLCIWGMTGFFFLTALYSVGELKEITGAMRDTLRLCYIPFLMYFFYPIEKARLACWFFVAAMVLTFFLALLKVYGGIPIGHKFNYANAVYSTSAAVFKSHIKTNFFMAFAAFFMAERAIQSRALRWKLMPLICMMCFYIFYLSWGRTGQVIFGVLALVLILQVLRRWHRFVAIVGLSLAVGMVYLSSDNFQFRVHQLATDMKVYQEGGPLSTSSMGARVTFLQNSITLAKEQLWLGWGQGSFLSLYAERFPDTLQTDNPHNEYMLIWVETGAVGLSLLLLLFLSQLYFSKRLAPDLKRVAQGVVIAFMVGCIANSWLRDFTEGSFFVLMTAVLFASMQLKANELKVAQLKGQTST